MRVPLAASGWPMAIAPPQAFVRVRSRPSSRSTARYCGANASFTSTRSICSSFSFAFSSALRAAGAGPMPMCFGSTPATAHATRRPSGFNPCAFAYSVLASEEYAKAHGLKPLGRLVAWAVAGVEPKHMGIGPAPAARKALEKAKLKLEQMDLVEVNEAFAPQYLAVERELG